MNAVTQHSLIRATDEAVRLWALTSAQYPSQHQQILDVATASVIEATSAFALHARRAMEILPRSEKFPLVQSRWIWVPTAPGEIVRDLWDALSRIIHAQRLTVGFEKLPPQLSAIGGGAVVVPYIQAATDRKPIAFIDPFALAYAYLYDVYPRLVAAEKKIEGMH